MFWAGEGTWKARYASGELGVHQWHTECNESSDDGLQGATGTIKVVEYQGTNPLYRRGPLRISRTMLAISLIKIARHSSGSAIPVGWVCASDSSGLAIFNATSATGNRKVLTSSRSWSDYIPICRPSISVVPMRQGFLGRKITVIRPAYFDAADQLIGHIVHSGIVPCLVGLWGFHMPWMGEARLKQHWRYVIARYAAYPTVLCVAGEANLPYYLAAGFPFDDRKQVTRWTDVKKVFEKSIPTPGHCQFTPQDLVDPQRRGAIDDPTLLSFDMLQTGHGDIGSLAPTVDTSRWTYDQNPTMPFLNSEVCYEGICACDDSIQRLMAWSCLLSGAAGHTYGANGIWQVNRPDQPYGKSPHGTDYGQTSWDEALALPGSNQTGLAGRIFVNIHGTN